MHETVYPCRVCTKIFHMKCVEKKGLLKNDIEKKSMLQAFSNIGWSCFECVNMKCLKLTF
jgi:hypothetical protein